MSNDRQIPWPRLFAEGGAIVISILLAFAIDAWWTERQDRANEAELLARLHAEISLSLDGLDNLVFQIECPATIELYNKVEEALSAGEESLEFPTLTLNRALFMSSFEADTPVLTALIGSGRLELIEDPKIIESVAYWESRLRNYAELVQRSRFHLDSQLVPALIERADIGPVFAGRSGIDEIKFGIPDPSTTTQINIDRGLKGLLGARMSITGLSCVSVEWIRKAGAELLGAIESSQINQ